MNYILKGSIVLVILLKLDLVFSKDMCILNKGVFFGNDGKGVNLNGNACYYYPKAGKGENALFKGGKGGNVNVENGAVVFGGGIKAGKGGNGSIGGDGGNINFEDKNKTSSIIKDTTIEAGKGGSGFFKSGKGGSINNNSYKKYIKNSFI